MDQQPSSALSSKLTTIKPNAESDDPMTINIEEDDIESLFWNCAWRYGWCVGKITEEVNGTDMMGWEYRKHKGGDRIASKVLLSKNYFEESSREV